MQQNNDKSDDRENEKKRLKNEELILIIIREVIPALKEFFEQQIRIMKEYEYPKYSLSVKVFGILLGAVIVTSFPLTFWNRLSGESFSFLMGVVIGYIMSHLRTIALVEEKKGSLII